MFTSETDTKVLSRICLYILHSYVLHFLTRKILPLHSCFLQYTNVYKSFYDTVKSRYAILLSLDFIDNLGFILSALCNQ